MRDGYLPDLGVRLSEDLEPGGAIAFASFPISQLARVEQDLFSVTANLSYQGEPHAVTLDIPRPQMLQLAAAMPSELAVALVRHFSGEFRAPQVVELPMAVDLFVEAVLGEAQQNDEEAYVPLVATTIRGNG
jgi:hypothetical protein